MAASHWHVRCHREDDDVWSVDTLVIALEYAANELDRIADFEHDGISANGDNDQFEQAYRCFQRSERYNGLVLNARNIITQGTVPAAERAPLYQDEPEQGPRWQIAANHVVEEINTNGPDAFTVWECVETECEPKEDED